MQQLTGLDASFLALETANTTGHVGGLSVLDPSGAPRPLTLARLTEVMAERVALVPVLRRKLLNVPLGLDQPYWTDDPDFDIEYHVREIALPRPGSDAQLTEQVSRLHARPLDRSRPLWEIYLITGLAKKRAAVYTKIHHAAIDGASGAELLTVLFDLTPARPRAAARRAVPARQPAGPAAPGREGRRAAGLAPGADRADHQRAGQGASDPGPGGEHAGRRHARAEPRRRRGHRHQTGTRARDAVQQADHAAPQVRVPQRGPGHGQDGEERLRRVGQRRRDGDVRRGAAALAHRPRRAAGPAANRDDPGVGARPGQQGSAGQQGVRDAGPAAHQRHRPGPAAGDRPLRDARSPRPSRRRSRRAWSTRSATSPCRR